MEIKKNVYPLCIDINSNFLSFRDNRNLDSDEDDGTVQCIELYNSYWQRCGADYDCETGDYPSLESFSSVASDPAQHSPGSPEQLSLSPRPALSPPGSATPRSAYSPSSAPTSGEIGNQ